MKLKTNSGAKKRFRVKKSGKIKRKKQGLRHLMILSQSKNQKRHLRKGTYVHAADAKRIHRLLPNG
ncbi:MAG: 50S ribosomal protein L35 [Deltaproteobacteria bacterium RIFCSPHIGHO2_02_FULL_40_11]|nr:MAG: 50S ribosomal protein L35 [Deltaproteobacteria bacterium RIFCSPHIGHO2_02_FULL_40_11]